MTNDFAARRDAAQRTDQFGFELSELGRKHGIGIASSPALILLDREDYLFDYSVGDESELRLGDAQRDSATRSRRDAQSGFDAIGAGSQVS